jgi:hypothetical protein
MEKFTYSADLDVMYAQLRKREAQEKNAKRRTSIVKFLTAAAWRRENAYLQQDQFAEESGISEGEVSKILSVLEFYKVLDGYSVSDDNVESVIVGFVDEHGGKAPSGIWSALFGSDKVYVLDDEAEKFIKRAEKNGYTPQAIMDAIISRMGG